MGYTKKADPIKKELQLRYYYSYNQGLSTMMGIFATNYGNRQISGALHVMNKILDYVQKDHLNRLFLETRNGPINYEEMMYYDELVAEFRKWYGSEPAIRILNPETGKMEEQKRKFSYLDLRTGQPPPEPKEDKVYIARSVPIYIAWKGRPADYVAYRIGFVYKKTVPVLMPDGQVVQQEHKVPMFSWDDPKIKKKYSNCVPWVYYIQNKQAVLNHLLPLVSELEAIKARYLHRERMSYTPVVDPDNPITEQDIADDLDFDDGDVSDSDEDDGINED